MQIHGFQNLKQIYRGDRSSVFRAVRESDQASVILKLLAAEFPTQAQLARLRHEFEIGGHLNSIPGVIRYLDLLSIGTNVVLVLEDIGGTSLAEYQRSASSDPIEVTKLVVRIAEILGAVHDKGVIHKDLNPSNIVVSPHAADLRLIDFEIATTLPREAQQLKSPETIEGTLDYISPEQTGRMNCPLDSRTDLYSLGVLFYEALSGRRPFRTDDKNEMVHHHIAMIPEPPLEPSTPLAKALSDVVLKLMAKAPERRYKSAYGLIYDLQTILDSAQDSGRLKAFQTGREDFSNRLLIPAKIYGREAAVAQLNRAYANVTTGKTELVLVTGPAGIGKSALIHEIHKPIAATRAYFLSGKFDQFGRTAPYSAFLQAFSQLVRRVVSESPERTALWKSRLLEMADGSISVLCELIPELVWLVGEQPQAAPLAPQEAQSRFLHLLGGFVRVFSSAENPLVLFIDDLQWADSASLGLLERLLEDASIRGLLILAAYRDQEVDASHPLKLMLGRIAPEGGAPQEISLAALSKESLVEMTADTFSMPTDKVEKLTEVLIEKTGGNPFFYTQMLRHIYEKGLTEFEAKSRMWKWDLNEVSKLRVSENVVELMTTKIETLPDQTARLLSIAACIGPQFSLADVANAAASDTAQAAKDLEPAMQEELIVPLDSDYRLARETEEVNPQYTFLHDRIQQAAAERLEEDERSEIHLKVGRTLLKEAQKENRVSESVFVIVDHLNEASPLIESEEERVQLVGLNLTAGQKAKNAAAFQAAAGYLDRGLAILDPLDPWNRYYDLVFRLQLEQAECFAFRGERTRARDLFLDTLGRAENTQDRALVHESLIHFHTNNGDFEEAYKTARTALKPFRVGLPPGFVPPLFIKDLIRCRILFKGRRVEELIALPECTDPEKLTAMRLLSAVLKACYQIRPELCVANAFKLINMALKFGNMRDLAVPYMAAGGIFLGSIVGKHDVGEEFGRLSLALIEKFRNEKQRAEVNFIYGYFVHFWQRSALETEQYFRRSYESALQTGDHFHLSCAACTLVESGWIRGTNFDELSSLAETYNALLRRVGNRESLGAIQAVTQAIANLRGQTESRTSYNGENFDEASYRKEIATFESLHFSHFYFINKMQTLYLWGDYERAWEISEESKKYLKYSVGMLHTVEHYFYRSLILAAYEGIPKSKRISEIKKTRTKMKKWAAGSPTNFRHKVIFLEAELARLSGDVWQALKLYQDSIRSAEADGFPQNKSIAEERCADFLLKNDHIELGHKMLQAAHAGYLGWGATAKAEALVAQHPDFVLRQSGSESRAGTRTTVSTRSTSTTDHSLELDLGSVLKATQAITRELRLENVLGRLISIILESAGAQKGLILAPSGKTFVVEAEGTLGNAPVVLRRDDVSTRQDVSEAVLRYVIRTKESLVLDNASQSTLFSEEASSPLAQTKSLICAPVLHQGSVIALIYLVNNLSEGTFTPARLAVLNMLSAQAAISIENARHYDQLEEKVEERTRDLRIARETSDRLLLNILPVSIADELKVRGQVIPKLHKNATVLFTDFSQFTANASRMTPVDLVYTLGDFFSTFDEICERYGLEKLKTIGDAYMAVAGVPLESPTHAVDACLAALEMLRYVESKKKNGVGWSLRVGLHTGEIIAGVIGKNKFVYDIWGDTVNIASRMESGSTPGNLNVSGELWSQVQDYFEGQSRGFLEAKNRGELAMHFVFRLKEAYSADSQGLVANESFLKMIKEWRQTGLQPVLAETE